MGLRSEKCCRLSCRAKESHVTRKLAPGQATLGQRKVPLSALFDLFALTLSLRSTRDSCVLVVSRLEVTCAGTVAQMSHVHGLCSGVRQALT